MFTSPLVVNETFRTSVLALCWLYLANIDLEVHLVQDMELPLDPNSLNNSFLHFGMIFTASNNGLN